MQRSIGAPSGFQFRQACSSHHILFGFVYESFRQACSSHHQIVIWISIWIFLLVKQNYSIIFVHSSNHISWTKRETGTLSIPLPPIYILSLLEFIFVSLGKSSSLRNMIFITSILDVSLLILTPSFIQRLLWRGEKRIRGTDKGRGRIVSKVIPCHVLINRGARQKTKKSRRSAGWVGWCWVWGVNPKYFVAL